MRSRTYIATPPGATIKEQLVDRGMSQKEFALRMDLSEKHVSKLLNGDVALTPEVAFRLEMVLGLPAHFWNNLESIYREKLLLAREENAMDEDIALVERFPYEEMAKHGWVVETHRKSDRVMALRKYFEVIRLAMLKNGVIPGLEKSDADWGDKFTEVAWKQKARVEARSIPVKTVNLQKLKKQTVELKKMNGEGAASELLADCGIALVVLPGVQSREPGGFTFYEKNRIVMGIAADTNEDVQDCMLQQVEELLKTVS